MRVGIIADLHGGLNEMQQALGFLQTQDVDMVICAGDLVDFGNYGDEVVEYIIDAKIPCVKGNHDHQATQKQVLRQRKRDVDKATTLLRPETLEHLEKLPDQIRFEWENKTILLTHATPWGEDMYVYPDSTTPLLRRVVKEAHADITILGHTHRPMWIDINGSIIINPGSTSQNYFMDVGTYGILSLPDYEFELHSVENGGLLDLPKKQL